MKVEIGADGFFVNAAVRWRYGVTFWQRQTDLGRAGTLGIKRAEAGESFS
jgi:hypothetical protein